CGWRRRPGRTRAAHAGAIANSARALETTGREAAQATLIVAQAPGLADALEVRQPVDAADQAEIAGGQELVHGACHARRAVGEEAVVEHVVEQQRTAD